MYEALSQTMYEARTHTMYVRFRTLTSRRLDQQNQISTRCQKQSQNSYFYLWFCHFLVPSDHWLFFSAFDAYICMGSHIQCTYTSRYNVWGSLRTVYGHLPIQCTYEDEYDVRIKLSRKVCFWQKKVEKMYSTYSTSNLKRHKKEDIYWHFNVCDV